LLEIADRVKAKGADLCILNLGGTSTATGRVMFTVIVRYRLLRVRTDA